MPGSGASLPTALRLVLAGYVGIASGLFATALACAAAAVVVFFGDYVNPDDDTIGQLFELALMVCILGSGSGRRLRRSRRSRRVTGFRGCSGGPAIHTRPR